MDAEFFKQHPIYDVNVLAGLETIFKDYIFSDDTKKLTKMRVEDINAFRAFAVLCLRHTVGVMTWRVKHRKFRISDFFSISDEGLALVVLENNAKVWKDKAYGIDTTESCAKYMVTANKGDKNKVRKSWSNEGKQRFNDICLQVRELRSFTISRNNENELARLWDQSSRKERSSRHGDGEDAGRVSNRVIEIFEG